MRIRSIAAFSLVSALLVSGALLAAATVSEVLNFPFDTLDFLCLGIFLTALALAVIEEFTGLRKSKPVVLGAGLIWALIAWGAQQDGSAVQAQAALRNNLLQSAELMLFLLVAMTYISAMSERGLFGYLRDWLAHQRVSYRRLFWLTGALAFGLSPLLDNLTTALLVGAAVVALGEGSPRFVALGSINVVVAVNAGGVFSPFGDITTLMVWQQNIQTAQGVVDFWSFFSLFPAALVSYLVPAVALDRALPDDFLRPEGAPMRPLRGAGAVTALFFATVATAVVFQTFLHLPGVVGMLTGLSYLQFFGYYLKRTHRPFAGADRAEAGDGAVVLRDGNDPFDIFDRIARVEWDTLFFLYGVALCVGGLGYLGHLSLLSEALYSNLGTTMTNISAGLLSAVLENIPAMFMVLNMNPTMSLEQWLLVTLSTGTGGSLLAIGSAAGVALLGQARGAYTFWEHFKWMPVILLGFIAGVITHLLLAGLL